MIVNYAYFAREVARRGWTVAQLRSENAPPDAVLLRFMEEIGLARYEQFVLRFERENRPAMKLRKLTLGEWMSLMLLAGRIEREVDSTLADLVRSVAGGNDGALVGLIDRLIDLERHADAERLKRLIAN